MSAGKTSEAERFYVLEAAPFWRVHEHNCPCCGGRGYADMFRTRASAEHAARMLNAGIATVDRYQPVGCRVVMGR